MNGLVQSLRGLGVARLVTIGAVGFGLLGFFFFLVTRLTAPDYSLLYGELPVDDSGAIVTRLESMGIPYRLSANGTQVFVPDDQVSRLRLSLAEQGLPSGGSVGYEIFDETDNLGTTRFVQNVNLVRALEGELARTITELNRVQAARVHLVLPRRELFQRQDTRPTASVFLRLSGAIQPGHSQILAIQHLVAAAVPGLAPEHVAIVDGRGSLLASGDDESSEIGYVATRTNEVRRKYETQLKHTLESLLERSIGVGQVRAEVAAVMNFDRITSNDEVYDPDGQVVRSTQAVEEQSTSTDGGGSVSVGNNLPDSGGATSAPDSQSSEQRTEETVNFEISRTVRSHVQESGKVERLSIAILVDGTHITDPETEETTYQPRSDEELEQIASLARSAVAFDADRGDTLEVINMAFTQPEPIEAPTPPMFGLHKADYIKIAEIMVLALVALLVILLVLRPLVNRLFAIQLAQPNQAAGDVVVGPQGQPMLAGPDGAPVGEGEQVALPGVEGADEDDPDSMIDLSKVEGRVKASSVKKMGEIIDKHPDEAVSILRGWMAEGSA